MKKGDWVVLPEGTTIRFFSGSVLDKDPFKSGKMEYTARGKIIDKNATNIAIDPWHNGSTGYGGILNVPKSQWRRLKKPDEDVIFHWDTSVYRRFILSRSSLPEEGSRVYEVRYVQDEGKDGIMETTYEIWALNRKVALRVVKDSNPGAEQYGARLAYSRQDPFMRAIFVDRKPAAKKSKV